MTNGHVVGLAYTTSSGGMQDIGTLGWNRGEARDVSSDGSVVVGAATNASGAYRVS